VKHGRLLAPCFAPAHGETEAELVRASSFAVKQVLSGQLAGPADYYQEEDEWALVLSGSATLSVGDATVTLAGGDWVWLPAATPHRLIEAAPGTSWVTVHGRPTSACDLA